MCTDTFGEIGVDTLQTGEYTYLQEGEFEPEMEVCTVANKPKSLRDLRIQRGELQAETAKALNLNYKTYNHYECGRRPVRDLHLLPTMAAHFGVTIEEMVEILSRRAPNRNEEVHHATG